MRNAAQSSSATLHRLWSPFVAINADPHQSDAGDQADEPTHSLPPQIFGSGPVPQRVSAFSSAIVLIAIAVLIYIGARMASGAPSVIHGPAIDLKPQSLPLYALLSTGRMAAAYVLSLVFSLVYGYLAAYHRRAEQVLLPLLDVLQSVPILSFLPVVLLSLSAVLPMGVAAEIASIVLIFTSQAWNITFAWYQSLTTIPKELREASRIFRFSGWLRLKTLELPFAALSLIWNSMMSWAGGWFFLMAVEIFTVGQRDFQLPGLGAYLHEAAQQGDLGALAMGTGALVLVIVLLDQLMWRPLLVWADHYKLEMIENENPPTSWFNDLLQRSRVLSWVLTHVWSPISGRLDMTLAQHRQSATASIPSNTRPWGLYLLGLVCAIALVYGIIEAGTMLLGVSVQQWLGIGLGVGATFLRVLAALVIALAWTIPVGVWIGGNPRISALLQPVVQIAASVPATALFPAVLLVVVQLPSGLSIGAVLLMLAGTQWYLLFNIIAGASAIPQDLKYTSAIMQLSRLQRWRTLILPALFPYIVTGAITAVGGAWNASIVAEYTTFSGQTLQTVGIGAMIAHATATGDYPLLLAATVTMVMTVVLVNRLVWRRLYRMAEEQYRME